MEAKLCLFCVKKSEENAVYSHLTLGADVQQVLKKFNDDITYLVQGATELETKQVESIVSYFKDCSLWCLGSIDFVSGELSPVLEEHSKLIDVLEVLKNDN